MKPEPPRLLDDPAFLAETGCNLADEAAALENPNLPRLRARLMAALPAAPAQPRASPWRWVGGGLLVLTLLWLALPGEEAAPEPEVAPQPGVASPRPATLLPEPDAPPGPPAQVHSTGTPGKRAKADAATPQSTLSAPQPDAVAAPQPPPPPEEPPSPAAPPASPPDATDPRGDLARQLAAFEAAEDQSVAGDHQAALGAYEVYLERGPNGHFRAEAELSRLRQMASLGDAEAAERLAARLAEDPALATRRAEILSMRLSALVRLGRCDEARALAAALSTASVRKTAATCR